MTESVKEYQLFPSAKLVSAATPTKRLSLYAGAGTLAWLSLGQK